jgi:putative DNA primase/helicase
MPAAISGQGWHVATLRVARALRWGLELDEAQTRNLLSELYNPRCDPPWSETEIAHKVDAADRADGAPFPRGALLPPQAPDLLGRCSEQNRTDSGNAERFFIRFADRVRYCTPRKRWLLWTGQRWEWDERDQVLELAKECARGTWDEIFLFQDEEKKRAVKHAHYTEQRQGLTNMVALAQSKCAILPAELDADPWALNVKNGTLDLRTGELREHRRQDLITKQIPIDFDPAAKSELWDDCLAKFTGGDDEMAAYLRRAIGYALVGRVTEKAFWFAYGAPDGGKSTFIAAISAAMGDYHVSTDADTWLQRRDVGGNRGDIVRLLGARLVTCVEIQKGARFDAKLLKGVTGGDIVTGAAKYEADVSFEPTFAVWFAANDAPAIHEDDAGMWRRVRRVPFTNSIPLDQQDRTVQTRIKEPEHARAVLAWAVRGCREWQRDGLGTCAAIEASSAAYRREQDRVAGFFEDRCEFDPLADVSSRSLRDEYEKWCQKQRTRPVGQKELAAKLRERGCESRKVHGGVMDWGGLRLTDE